MLTKAFVRTRHRSPPICEERRIGDRTRHACATPHFEDELPPYRPLLHGNKGVVRKRETNRAVPARRFSAMHFLVLSHRRCLSFFFLHSTFAVVGPGSVQVASRGVAAHVRRRGRRQWLPRTVASCTSRHGGATTWAPPLITFLSILLLSSGASATARATQRILSLTRCGKLRRSVDR
jgi:hypothetical protein